MLARLLLLFILVPLIDLVLLLFINQLTHWTTTVAVVVASGIIGAWLAKWQTDSVGFKIREQLQKNAIPSALLTDGAMILFAGGLLITPGLITDAFGLSLLIPAFRNYYKKFALNWIKSHFEIRKYNFDPTNNQPDVVDGEVVDSKTQTAADNYDEPVRVQ